MYSIVSSYSKGLAAAETTKLGIKIILNTNQQKKLNDAVTNHLGTSNRTLA